MEKRLLALAVGLSLAHVVTGNSGATYSPFHFPQVNNDSSLQRGGGQHLFNMTYRPLDDLDHNGLGPGVEGEGRRSFNVADASWSWVGECRSNSSDKWGVTWPVCSTRFTSLVVMVVVTVVLAVITLWTILGNVLVLCALYKAKQKADRGAGRVRTGKEMTDRQTSKTRGDNSRGEDRPGRTGSQH